MNYELFYLEKLVDANIRSSVDPDYLETLLQESERIQDAVKVTMISLSPDSALHYLRQHQYGLIELVNNIENHFKSENIKPDNQWASETLGKLTFLLEHFHQRYKLYFDWDAPMPESCLKVRINLLQQNWQAISFTVAQGELPRDFINTLDEVFTAYKNIENRTETSFAELIYLENFLKLLSKYLKKNPVPELFEIILFLTSINYNHPGFYNYFQRYIVEQLSYTKNNEARLEMLNYFKKRICQNAPLTTKIYKPKLPQIALLMQKAIEAEIEYLTNLYIPSGHFTQLNNQFKVDLTVKQLAIFINLQTACGIIVSEKPKLIHQFATEHYSTVDLEHISEKSFKNSYYANALPDLEKILEKLTEMLIIGQRRYDQAKEAYDTKFKQHDR